MLINPGYGKPVDVLLVEDNPGDARLTQEAFRAVKRTIDLRVASDGIEAKDILERKGIHVEAPRPDLILLDLNIPKLDGRELLSWIKNDEDLKAVPTVILTTSDAERDVAISYQLQANSYLIKPVQLEAFEDMVRSLTDFWLTKVRLPIQR